MNVFQYWWCVKTLKIAYQVKKETGFPASAMTAQAILESYYGEKVPVDLDTGKVSNNLFGIKCTIRDGVIIRAGDNGWVKDLTREWDSKEKDYYLTMAYFRAYKSYESCFRDYVGFIRTNKRYKDALNCLDDPKRYIKEIWKAGYATDTYENYVLQVWKIIDQVNRIPVILLKLG
jgi:peptidoglycan hydrolase FlgJ